MKEEEKELIAWGGIGVLGIIGFLLLLFCLHYSITQDLKHKKEIQEEEEEEEEEKRKHKSLWHWSRNKRERKSKKKKRKRTSGGVGVAPQLPADIAFQELEVATREFSPSNLLKVGHSGTIYTGVLEKGNWWSAREHVVIKRFHPPLTESGVPDLWVTELEFYRHASGGGRFLVPLLGKCRHGNERLLVYRYMVNGDLAKALTSHNNNSARAASSSSSSSSLVLPWRTRLNIALNVANALSFLHQQCHFQHRCIEGSSILLGKEFEVRLGSLTEVKRLDDGETPLYDMYCFGRLLLDLLSGLDISGCTDTFGEAWMLQAFPLVGPQNRKYFLKMIDRVLVTELDHENVAKEIMGVAYVARACMASETSKHLSMKKIYDMLRSPQNITTPL